MRCGGGWHHWRLPSSNTQHAYLFLALFLFSSSSSFTVRMYLFIHGWWKWTREKKEGNSGSDDEIPGTFFPFLPFLDVIYDVPHTQQETIWGRLFTITSVASLGRVHRKGRGSHYRLTVYKFGVGRGQSYWQIDEATNCRGNKRADVIDENVLCIYRPIDGLLDGPSLYPWCAHYYYQRRTRLNTPTGEKSRSERMDEPLKQWKRERVVFRGTCFFWRCSSRRLAKKRRREQESMIGASSFYLFLSLSLSLYSLYIYAVRCTYMFDKPR